VVLKLAYAKGLISSLLLKESLRGGSSLSRRTSRISVKRVVALVALATLIEDSLVKIVAFL